MNGSPTGAVDWSGGPSYSLKIDRLLVLATSKTAMSIHGGMSQCNLVTLFMHTWNSHAVCSPNLVSRKC